MDDKQSSISELSPYLGWWTSVHGCDLPSTPAPCCLSNVQFPPRPRATAPHPSPHIFPRPIAFAHITYFYYKRKDDISILETLISREHCVPSISFPVAVWSSSKPSVTVLSPFQLSRCRVVLCWPPIAVWSSLKGQ